MIRPGPIKVENPRYVMFIYQPSEREERLLYVTLDGQDVAIPEEQKLLEPYGVVSMIGPPETDSDDPARRYYAYVEPSETWQGGKLEGCTKDQRIVDLTRRFWRDLRTGEWREGTRLEVSNG